VVPNDQLAELSTKTLLLTGGVDRRVDLKTLPIFSQPEKKRFLICQNHFTPKVDFTASAAFLLLGGVLDTCGVQSPYTFVTKRPEYMDSLPFYFSPHSTFCPTLPGQSDG